MKISKVLFGLLVVAAACTNSVTRETPNGFKYTLAKEGDGVIGKPGQIIFFNMLIKDSKDSVWVDTYNQGFPKYTPVPDSLSMGDEDGVTQMMRMLSKGDSVTFEISVKELFRDMVKQPVPPHIDSTLDLSYTITLEEILNRENVRDYQTKLEEEFMAKREKMAVEQLGKDTVIIDDYLKKEGIVAQKQAAGSRFVITREGTGPKAESGQKVMVNYTGYLLDGTYFDTSVESVAVEKGLYDSLRAARFPYEPMEVVIDRSGVIKGWHEALKEMNEGSKATFYIPSTLAYGPDARGDKIKENSILVFDIEVVDIN